MPKTLQTNKPGCASKKVPQHIRNKLEVKNKTGRNENGTKSKEGDIVEMQEETIALIKTQTVSTRKTLLYIIEKYEAHIFTTSSKTQLWRSVPLDTGHSLINIEPNKTTISHMSHISIQSNREKKCMKSLETHVMVLVSHRAIGSVLSRR